MSHDNANTTSAGTGPVDRPVGRPLPERGDLTAECCYCKQRAPGWRIAEGAVGKRWREDGTLEYHCYAAKCWD